MKRTRIFGLAGMVAGTALTVAVGAERDVLNNWRNVVSTNDFKKTLADVRAVQEDWPVVHSVKHRENKIGERAALQADYRGVARVFLQGLEAYEKTLCEMSPEAFCEGADMLLDVRSRFMKNPSYINYFLVDCINRVLFVNLGERLTRIEDVPISYDKIAERLAEFRCNLSTIGNLISIEYGADRFSMAAIEDMEFLEKLDAIGMAMGQDMSFLTSPRDWYNVYGLRILEKCSLTALSHRLVASDLFIGTRLPALLLFRRKTMQFTAMDSFPQIRAVLGDETYMPLTLQRHKPLAAIAAYDFLHMLRSENGRVQMLCFPEMPRFFTRESIEQFEKEEAKLEAQREAKEQNK